MVKLVGLTNLVCDDSIFSGFLGIPAGQYPRILFGGKISRRYPWSLFGGGTFSSSKICDAFPRICSILALLKKDEFTELIKTNKRRSPKFNSKRPLFGMIKLEGPTVKLPGENPPPKTKMTSWKTHHLKIYFLLNMGIFQWWMSFKGIHGHPMAAPRQQNDQT